MLGSTPVIYSKNSNSFSGRSLYVEKHMQIELKMPWVSVSTQCQSLFLPLSDFPGVSMGLEWSGNWGEGLELGGTSLLGSVTLTTWSLSPHIVHWSRRFRAGSFASSSSFLTVAVVVTVMINLYLKRGKRLKPFNCVPLTLTGLSFPLTSSIGC